MNSRVLFILDVLMVGYGQYVYEMCFDKHSSLNDKYMESGFQLDCGPTGRITNVYVLSGMGSCRNQVCYGETISLLVDIHQCYWKSRCQIQWPDRIIEKVEGELNKKCLRQSADFLHIKAYTCFYPKPENGDFIVLCGAIDKKTVAYRAGIIRSHDSFPWEYGVNKMECSATLFWILDTKLYVTIQTLDVSDLDSLHFLVGDKDTVLNKAGSIQLKSYNGLNGTFKFLIHPDSNAGSGFVLCFKFSNEDLQDQDICKSLTTNGVVGQPVITTEAVPPSLPAVTLPLENKKTTTPTGCKKKKGNKCPKPIRVTVKKPQRDNRTTSKTTMDSKVFI